MNFSGWLSADKQKPFQTYFCHLSFFKPIPEFCRPCLQFVWKLIKLIPVDCRPCLCDRKACVGTPLFRGSTPRFRRHELKVLIFKTYFIFWLVWVKETFCALPWPCSRRHHWRPACRHTEHTSPPPRGQPTHANILQSGEGAIIERVVNGWMLTSTSHILKVASLDPETTLVEWRCMHRTVEVCPYNVCTHVPLSAFQTWGRGWHCRS